MAMLFSGGVPKSGMMEIGIAMVLHDRFTNQAGQASRAIKGLQNDAMRALQSNLSTAYQIGSIGNAAFQRLSEGISEAINYGAEFIDTMVTVKAITEATGQQMAMLETTALNLGRDTMYSSQEVASGMKYLAMAGNKAEEINNIIKSATYLSGATGLDLGGKGGAADLLTNVMRTFQLEGEDMAFYVGDVLTKATTSANISITDLATSIRFASSDMINLGYKLPEISAAIGTLGNMGIQSSMAGTALANMARYLNRSISDPKYKGYKYLQSVGLTKEELTNADGTLLDLYSIMTKIKAATASMSPTELNLFTTGVFGVRGNRAAVAMMRDLESFKNLRDQIMATPDGYSKGITEQRMATISGQLKILKSQVQNFMVAFTKAVQPVVIPILQFVSRWLEGIRVILGTVPGKIIAITGLAATGILGLISKLMLMRARFRMLTIDSTVTGKNMFASLIGGWQAVTMSARDYQSVLMAINAQQSLGILGNPAITRGIVRGNIRSETYTTKKVML
jgi:phage tail tape measure protein, TP901 family, core region